MFKRILIANRGEIALRIIRACREMEIETVVVFSEADRGAAYLDLADEAICIGPARSAESYLKIDRIISACEVGGAEAVHPGFGFLSENAHFADICRSCDYEFIGPTSEAMALVGDKNSAREIAQKVGVPCVPGSDGLIKSDGEALKFANSVGFPVLIKATAGGGGRGMRVANNAEQLKTAIQQAVQEAKAAFGNGGVYLEKFIDSPRHIEVQIIADHHGNIVHLWERDCSAQRRHQKLIEESPSPCLAPATRQAMCEAATQLVKESGYTNAGTVEFLLDWDNNFYFIEMNARIQVEHPVTELVTGIDLVKTQIRVAAGEKLPFKQSEIQQRGWAIECRINAEDPDHHFRPCPGTIEKLIIPGGFGVRFDSHVHAGYIVSPTYDSMIGKLLVHQSTREEAIACMRRCLRELRVEGIKTTAPLQLKILESRDFQDGFIDTLWIEHNFMKNN
ncbi:MAG: acetyl-CoA carboxylase biotin carboxylase subunit [Planctomycetaceae bacterium]|jgi:acetyl-CoA carboxylase biotin carboxylase subunit|nr:acetyl-CoA carboxylase biotin carboxylase subunit [Planctomycetaceae bacterium]